MPRRGPSQRTKPASKPRPIDRKESRLKRWNTVADIELDEQDQFHASRDKILLDEGDEEGEDGGEEEVFALQGMSSDWDDEDEDEPSDEDEEEDSDDMHIDATTSKSKTKSKLKAAKTSSSKSASDSEEEETWGRSKGAYYSSNAAQLDSEDEEANELEEQEARRIQAKALEGMTDQDFGLEDVVESDVELPEAMEQHEAVDLTLAEAPQDKQTILRTLEKEYPETLALARDWEDTIQSLIEAKTRVEAINGTETDLVISLQHMYYQTLLTYATTLAFYLHMRATEKYAGRPELLRRHPILTRLLTLKSGIHTLEALGADKDANEEDDDDDDAGIEEEDNDDVTDAGGDLWSLIQKQGLEAGELADLLEDAGLSAPNVHSSPSPSHSSTSPSLPPPTTSSLKKSKPPKSAKSKNGHTGVETETRREKTCKTSESAAVHDSDQDQRKRKRKRKQAAVASTLFDLHEPEYNTGTSAHTRTRKHTAAVPVIAVDTDPYGESSALGYHDASDKLARRKSLRFHVSRIESASSRRTNARAKAIGGDDDIPYRERRKERESRLVKEKEKAKEKGLLGAGGDDLDHVDPEVGGGEKKRKRKRLAEDDEEADDVGGADGYYELVKQATATKKARKKAEYEAATARPELEPESTSGPRSVTRAILKNKGLTPRRSKTVRNPRVKKRQKYEQAKKKVASQKAVYKGGIGDVSKYSGEQSGISKVVKSVRL